MKYFLVLISVILLYSCNDSSTNSPGEAYVRLYYIIPNPTGNDDYKEEFCLMNTSNELFKGAQESYYIKDNENSKWSLELGTLTPGQKQVVVSDYTARLLNSADTVFLFNTKNQLVQTVSYKDAKDGDTIWVK